MIPSIGDDLINVIKGEEKFTPVVKYYVHSDVAAVAMVSKNLGVYIISELQCDNLPDNVIKLNFEKDVYRIMGIGINSPEDFVTNSEKNSSKYPKSRRKNTYHYKSTENPSFERGDRQGF